LSNPLAFQVQEALPVEYTTRHGVLIVHDCVLQKAVQVKVVVFDHDTFFSDDFVDLLKEDVIISSNASSAERHTLVDRTK
jgi:hypothetical protein